MNEVTRARLQAEARVTVDNVGRARDHVLVKIVVVHCGRVSRACRGRFGIENQGRVRGIASIVALREIVITSRHGVERVCDCEMRAWL